MPGISKKTIQNRLDTSLLMQKYMLGFAFILFCSCKTIVFSKYFPLVKDKKTIYVRHTDSPNVDVFDTLICQVAMAKLTSLSTKARLHMVDTNQIFIPERIKVYYFIKRQDTMTDSIYLTDHSFAQNLYCFYKNATYVSWGWTQKMEYHNEFHKLFPKRLREGKLYRHNNGDYSKIFVYLGKETIIQGNQQYANCVKIDVLETIGQTKRTGTAWLARNAGVIKWEIKNDSVPFIKP